MCVCWYAIRHPASPAMNDEMPKATNFIRAVFTPIDAAARSFVRTASSRRPVALRRRLETASATRARTTRTNTPKTGWPIVLPLEKDRSVPKKCGDETVAPSNPPV